MLIRNWIQEVRTQLKTKPFTSHAVPEQFICLRTAQFVLHAGGVSPRASAAAAVTALTPTTRSVDRD